MENINSSSSGDVNASDPGCGGGGGGGGGCDGGSGVIASASRAETPAALVDETLVAACTAEATLGSDAVEQPAMASSDTLAVAAPSGSSSDSANISGVANTKQRTTTVANPSPSARHRQDQVNAANARFRQRTATRLQQFETGERDREREHERAMNYNLAIDSMHMGLFVNQMQDRWRHRGGVPLHGVSSPQASTASHGQWSSNPSLLQLQAMAAPQQTMSPDPSAHHPPQYRSSPAASYPHPYSINQAASGQQQQYPFHPQQQQQQYPFHPQQQQQYPFHPQQNQQYPFHRMQVAARQSEQQQCTQHQQQQQQLELDQSRGGLEYQQQQGTLADDRKLPPSNVAPNEVLQCRRMVKGVHPHAQQQSVETRELSSSSSSSPMNQGSNDTHDTRNGLAMGPSDAAAAVSSSRTKRRLDDDDDDYIGDDRPMKLAKSSVAVSNDLESTSTTQVAASGGGLSRPEQVPYASQSLGDEPCSGFPTCNTNTKKPSSTNYSRSSGALALGRPLPAPSNDPAPEIGPPPSIPGGGSTALIFEPLSPTHQNSAALQVGFPSSPLPYTSSSTELTPSMSRLTVQDDDYGYENAVAVAAKAFFGDKWAEPRSIEVALQVVEGKRRMQDSSFNKHAKICQLHQQGAMKAAELDHQGAMKAAELDQQGAMKAAELMSKDRHHLEKLDQEDDKMGWEGKDRAAHLVQTENHHSERLQLDKEQAERDQLHRERSTTDSKKREMETKAIVLYAVLVAIVIAAILHKHWTEFDLCSHIEYMGLPPFKIPSYLLSFWTDTTAHSESCWWAITWVLAFAAISLGLIAKLPQMVRYFAAGCVTFAMVCSLVNSHANRVMVVTLALLTFPPFLSYLYIWRKLDIDTDKAELAKDATDARVKFTCQVFNVWWAMAIFTIVAIIFFYSGIFNPSDEDSVGNSNTTEPFDSQPASEKLFKMLRHFLPNATAFLPYGGPDPSNQDLYATDHSYSKPASKTVCEMLWQFLPNATAFVPSGGPDPSNEDL